MQGRVVASGTEYLIELPTTYRLTSKSNLRNWVNLGSRSYRCFNDDYKKIISQFRYSLIEYILNERKKKLSGVYRSIYLHLSFLFFFLLFSFSISSYCCYITILWSLLFHFWHEITKSGRNVERGNEKRYIHGVFPSDNEFPNGHGITLSNFNVLDSG